MYPNCVTLNPKPYNPVVSDYDCVADSDSNPMSPYKPFVIFRDIVPLKQIEYVVYGDLINNIPKAIFYLLKGDYEGVVSRLQPQCINTP